MSLSKSRTRLLRRLARRKTRSRERAYLAEGLRCVEEVLRNPGSVRFLVASPRADGNAAGGEVLQAARDAGVEVVLIDDAELNQVANTDAPQGVLAVCDEPRWNLQTGRRVLLADGIQDPGNLGTLLRSAAAFGLDGVMVLDGSVDPFNPKVVRASAGTVAAMPILCTTWEAAAAQLDAWKSRVLVASAGGDTPVPDAAEPWALVLGNEARGVRPAIRRAASASVAITMTGDIDSLNVGVAGSILMYSLTREVERGE